MIHPKLRTMMMSGATTLVVSGLFITSANVVHAASTSSTDQQRLTTIVNKGNEEISRRLSTLTSLMSKISGATKLTDSDKATLTNEVSNEIIDLNALTQRLDSALTLADARADVQDIFTEYRVYALVAPKVALIRTADDQQVAEAKLTALIQKLQTRVDTAKGNGKDVTALQNALNDMTSKVNNAQSLSSSIEQKVISLQPSDYNGDHTILSGDRDQLKAAHGDNMAAYTDAKTIVRTLE